MWKVRKVEIEDCRSGFYCDQPDAFVALITGGPEAPEAAQLIRSAPALRDALRWVFVADDKGEITLPDYLDDIVKKALRQVTDIPEDRVYDD